MSLGRRFKALVAWIASFAILLTALAPAISHAVQRDAPPGWTEICSVTGAKFVRIDGSGSDAGAQGDADSPQAHAAKRCAWCATDTTAPGLPPAAPAGLTLLPLAFHVPELFLLAPRPLHAWATAQPRAPPSKT